MDRHRVRTLLVGVFAVLAVSAAVWVALGRRSPERDDANHLERAVLCGRDLQAGDVRAILERSSFYPPLVLCLAGALSSVIAVETAAVIVMLGFLAVTMAAVYGPGRALGGEETGVRLTKPTFGPYVGSPARLLARGRWRALAGAALAGFVAIAASLPWLGPRLFGLGAQVGARSFAQAAQSRRPDPLTVGGFAFYPRWP